MTCEAEAVGDLGDVCRRVRALESWWRPEAVESIRKALVESAALPARQSEATEAHRTAVDGLAALAPDGSQETQGRWREEQASVTRTRTTLDCLRAEETALLSLLEVELWWARTLYMRGAQSLEAQTAR